MWDTIFNVTCWLHHVAILCFQFFNAFLHWEKAYLDVVKTLVWLTHISKEFQSNWIALN